MTSERPTLRSLAEITGLAVSTVSQALRDSPDIAEDTRARVKLAAQQAGYLPNRAGVRLRTGKTNVVSLILNTEGSAYGLVEQLVFGLSESLNGTGYHLVVTPYMLSDSMAPIRYVVDTRSADGVIIARTQPDDPRVRYLIENNMPFATHGRTSVGTEHAYVDFDNAAFAYKAVGLLAARGRKRIGLLRPPAGLSFYYHTLEGFSLGLRERGLDEYPLGDIDIDSKIDEVKQRALALAREPNRPDGFVSSSELMTMTMISALEEAGLKLGSDFDVVTKQYSDFMRWFRPELILIHESHRETGKELGRTLLAAINGEAAQSLQVLLQPE
ncbi:MAG: LacI family DNA-binding transcriptional regulator [Rhizobiales bacterium]|nr:LacI family DNA-binding transcriptional regulator [Hyphomicrobiales bacterium]